MDETLARVATALLMDYASVYYININTGHYSSYSVNQGFQKLDLQTSGEDFFGDLERDTRVVVLEEDRETIFQNINKESLTEKLRTKNTLSFIYRLMIDGHPVYHTMRIMKDVSGEEGTIILGVLNVDAQVRKEQDVDTYNDIANSLANRYATLYYVDLETDHYMEYSASNEYRDLGIPQEGEDFFTESAKNIKVVLHPEDQERVLSVFKKKPLLEKTANRRRFTIEYRLILNGEAHYVRLVAMRSRNESHLIIALDTIDEEVRQKEELKAISEQSVIFSQIANSLASQYGMIYYIDTETDEYVEFSATDAYKEFNISPVGNDFFGTSQRNISMIVHPSDRERVFDALDKKNMLAALRERGSFTMTYQLMMKAGTSYTRMNVFWANDKKHLIMPIMNIDNEIQKENALKKMIEENAVFSQIAESLARQYDTIYYVDMLTDHYVEFASTDVYRSLEVQPSGDDFFTESRKNIERVIFPEDMAGIQNILVKSSLVKALQEKHMLTHTYRLLIGEDFMYARMSVIWATDNKHLIVGVMNIDQEVRREKEVQQQLVVAKERAYQDALTGVKNKAALSEYTARIQEEVDNNTRREYAVVVCDVNGLKQINDTYGHKAGDEYIIKASRMICDIFQHSPVFRTGGDEFVVILTGRDYLIRRELILALHDRSVRHISTQDVVISGGLSEYRAGKDSSFQAVFERADALMYEEKTMLKSMGAITREDFEAETKKAFNLNEDADILRIRRHVLIVEDEEINRMMLGNMLESSFELLYASDGTEALEQIRIHKDELALVLLDLQMPRMSGMDVLRVMKEEVSYRDIPVIVLTADQAAEVECLKLGAIDFIPKPYPTFEIIRARVNRCIELSEKRQIIQTTERDSLTNVFTMEYFLRYVRMFDQHYSDVAMDAIMLDVNQFHMLNERYGKQYGDTVLARLGNNIRQVARDVGGVGARLSGDTFLIYCPHRDDYDKLLERLYEGLAGDSMAEGVISLRMGVYAEVDKEIEIERRFDYAKNAANSVRGNYVKAVGIYDTKMHEAELYRARLLEDFRSSLENHHFLVYLQPKFDIRPDKPVLASAEALVRWNHPELGMISPGVFIPLLEDNGMIMELDQYVWRETAKYIRDWKDRFNFSVPVSVNVSRIDMMMPNLKGIFTGILEEFQLDVKDLILEITESAYTGDSDRVISTVKELRGMGMGFRVEMDDFGTGYSSLGMLSNLPIDALKLDMSFVRSAFKDGGDTRMIELIIDIADYLNVPVVAEGVETEEQYLTLKKMGCDLVQGYYFSKPVPREEFDRFMVERTD